MTSCKTVRILKETSLPNWMFRVLRRKYSLVQALIEPNLAYCNWKWLEALYDDEFLFCDWLKHLKPLHFHPLHSKCFLAS